VDREVCTHCGREVYTKDRCPECGLVFCEAHIDPKAHNCLVVALRNNESWQKRLLALEISVFIMVAACIWLLVNSH
jgi:predicted nucleic acid binding AN1-type Zn finger protein